MGTPAEIIRQRRIQVACSLIETRDYPIKAIADACGYQDPSFFSRSFRAVTGMSPRSYRRTVLGL